MIKKTVREKEIPYSLPFESQPHRKEEIQKLAKRLSLVTRELEVRALDIAMFSNALSRGDFPRSYVEEFTKYLEESSKEMEKVKRIWIGLFEEKLDDPPF